MWVVSLDNSNTSLASTHAPNALLRALGRGFTHRRRRLGILVTLSVMLVRPTSVSSLQPQQAVRSLTLAHCYQWTNPGCSCALVTGWTQSAQQQRRSPLSRNCDPLLLVENWYETTWYDRVTNQCIGTVQHRT